MTIGVILKKKLIACRKSIFGFSKIDLEDIPDCIRLVQKRKLRELASKLKDGGLRF